VEAHALATISSRDVGDKTLSEAALAVWKDAL